MMRAPGKPCRRNHTGRTIERCEEEIERFTA